MKLICINHRLFQKGYHIATIAPPENNDHSDANSDDGFGQTAYQNEILEPIG